jgi:hypothetical protein
VRANAQPDPLPSWNDGAAKKAIVEFVQATTTQGSLFKILAATLSGMSVDELKAEARTWLDTAKTYIVTGGGQDFVRVYADEVYGIPPEQVGGHRRRHEVRL